MTVRRRACSYDATHFYEGSFPARGTVINWLVQNAFFWETNININLP